VQPYIGIMPAKDIYHDIVKEALIKDEWMITDDPLILSIGKKIYLLIWEQKS